MKRILTFLIAALMLFTMCSCSEFGNPAGESSLDDQTASGDISLKTLESDVHQELLSASEVIMALPEGAEELKDFISGMERMRNEGLELLGFGMPRQASYCFAFVGGSISSLRLASQEIAGQTPIGFSDWDTVGAVSFSTPIPFLCEAISAEHRGDSERASKCRELAEYNLNEVIGSDKLSAITELDSAALETLIKNLIEFEKQIYWFYPADPIAIERTGLEWSPEYHLNLAAGFEELGLSGEAAKSYIDALAQDPFNPWLFSMCAKSMFNIGDIEMMQTYIEDGILIAPDDALLNALGALLWCAAGNNELAREHLETAKSANSTDSEVVSICQAVENALKGA